MHSNSLLKMPDKRMQFHTVIVGMGKTGFSCARYLAARNVSFAVTDSRAHPPMLEAMRRELPHVPLYAGGFDTELLGAAGRLLLSPGVPRSDPALKAAAARGVEICSDIELFCREARAPVVAITGSNGKSTVTSLVGDMARSAGLRAGVGGNLGTPALDLLAEGRADIYILELSSFQLESVTCLNAAAAVVLNVTEDHRDRYPSMEEYAAAKERIYAGDGIMVLNLDDPLVMNMRRPGRTVRLFTLGEPPAGAWGVREYDGVRWLVHDDVRWLPVPEVRIAGEHNVSNALAALALGDALGLPRAAMVGVLRTFPGLPHRCQWVRDHAGIRWYDDSKGTNVGASAAAIKGLAQDRKVVLIAGGDGKGADFSPLVEIAARHVRAAVLIGRDAPIIRRVLQNVVPLHAAASMDDAVQQAAALAQAGDVVLLSPACASLDMFEDYRARGAAFTAAVMRLGGS